MGLMPAKRASSQPTCTEIAAIDGPCPPARARGFGGRQGDAGGFGEIVADDAEIVLAPEIAGGGGVVLAGEDGGAREDEAGHWRD